ncbi:MAG: hypothetical protein KAH13_01065, partial [Tenericutes bacterium]|nr:hypothetical protein [Mycoplasmatota bacterium]
FDFFTSTSGMIREIYLQKFAADALVSFDTITKDYQKYLIDNRIMQDYQRIVKHQKEIKIIKPKYREAERTVLNYYLQDEVYRKKVEDRFNLMAVNDRDIIFILETIRALKDQIGEKSPLVLLRSDLSEAFRTKLDDLLLRKNYEYNIEDFELCIKQLEIQKLEEEINHYYQKAKLCLNDNDQPGYIRYTSDAFALKAKIQKIGKGQNYDKKTNT